MLFHLLCEHHLQLALCQRECFILLLRPRPRTIRHVPGCVQHWHYLKGFLWETKSNRYYRICSPQCPGWKSLTHSSTTTCLQVARRFCCFSSWRAWTLFWQKKASGIKPGIQTSTEWLMTTAVTKHYRGSGWALCWEWLVYHFFANELFFKLQTLIVNHIFTLLLICSHYFLSVAPRCALKQTSSSTGTHEDRFLWLFTFFVSLWDASAHPHLFPRYLWHCVDR